MHEGEDEVEKIYAYVNEPGIVPNTKNSRISNIKPFWNWMVQNRYRSEPWPRKIKKVKYVPRPAAPPTELVHEARTYFAMRGKTRQKWAQWRDYAIILTLAVSGARPKEVLSIMPEWVDLHRRLIYLPAKRTKTSVRREIPITEAEDVLKSLMGFHKKHVDAGIFQTDSPLFCGPAGKPYSRFGFAGMWNRVREEAGGWQSQAGDGLRDLNPYDLRHHFATTCIRADMDLITLADILGHATLETTRKYTHLSPEDIAKRGGFIGDYIARFGKDAEKKKRVRKPSLTM